MQGGSVAGERVGREDEVDHPSGQVDRGTEVHPHGVGAVAVHGDRETRRSRRLTDRLKTAPSPQRQADRRDEEWVARYRSKSRAVSPSSSVVPSPSSPYSPPTPHA